MTVHLTIVGNRAKASIVGIHPTTVDSRIMRRLVESFEPTGQI